MKDMKKVMITIKGFPMYSASEDDAFELLTDGEYMQEDGVATFTYVENSMVGYGDQLTTFNVEQDRVILRRNDGQSGDMIFSEDQKHHFLYDTPFGSVLLGIDTHSIVKNMGDDGGNLEIRYDIEVDNVSVSQNLFMINIKSFPQ